MNRDLWSLVGAQAFFVIGNMMLLPVLPVLGLQMSENARFSTLPVAINMLTMLVCSIPISLWMGKKGRKPAFLAGMMASGVAAIVLFAAIQESSFVLLLIGCVCFGMAMSCANFYRFAATELVRVDAHSTAVSAVMAVGVVAALVGPNLAALTKSAFFDLDFSASVLALFPLSALGALLVLRVRWPVHQHVSSLGADAGSADATAEEKYLNSGIFWRPVLTAMLGYGVMVLVMSATPLHMNHHGYDFKETAWVIQWHVLGMFAPSFFFGRLVQWLSLIGLMIVGVLVLISALLMNIYGGGMAILTLALILTGVGWNFMFLGASQWLVTLCGDHGLTKTSMAKVQGINEVCVFGLSGLAAFGSGWLIDSVGWKAVNYMSLPLLLALLCVLVLDARFSSKTALSSS
ncbi:MAG: MFS transporter [Agarilytica sp.]